MVWAWLKHAFAVESGPAVPNDVQRAAIDRICREVVRRRMTVPALAFLEMSRPLNYVGSQALTWFQPFLSVFTDSESPRQFAAFIEQRGSIEYVCQRIEAMERETPP